MAHLFIFGLGYTASRIAALAGASGWTVEGTGGGGKIDFADDGMVRAALRDAHCVLSSVPPDESGDPVLARYGKLLAGGWLGYLSSTGVYGDAQGAWVDESAPVGGGRRALRADCDAAWLGRGAHVLRLPGISGPGRSVFERLADGRAQRIDAPGQVFSRVHVDDIAAAVMLALQGDAPPGAYNLADDLPCSQNAVIEQACRLAGLPLPPLQTLEEANLSPAARRFYAENRRVANGKAKRVLGWQPRYPTYREGLASLVTGT